MRYLDNGLRVAREHRIIENIATAYAMIAETQQDLGNYKAALDAFKLGYTYSDSLAGLENYREIGRIEGKYDIEAQLREKQILDEKTAQDAQLARERRDRIQYSLIALFVILFFVALKMIRNFKISAKASQLVTLVAVLLFFEFLLVFLDPYVDNLSGSIPIYKLGLNLCLALLIFPVHEWLLKLLSGKKITMQESQ